MNALQVFRVDDIIISTFAETPPGPMMCASTRTSAAG